MGLDFTMFSMFGLVALSGVVVNDSIVLVDFINMNVAEGKPLKKALLDAGRTRLRPILLTSFTTIAGLAPILLERSFQAQLVIPMATSLVFGLMVTTVLCLLQVPVVYLIYAAVFMRDYPWDEGDPQHVPTEEEVDEATYGGGTLVGAHAPEPGGA
jgi:multidrug efflux pump subunit AcrB